MNQSKKRSNAQIETNRELRRREKAWEAMMDERIRTVTAIIREENEERKRLEGHRHSEMRENLHHQWHGDLPSGIDFG